MNEDEKMRFVATIMNTASPSGNFVNLEKVIKRFVDLRAHLNKESLQGQIYDQKTLINRRIEEIVSESVRKGEAILTPDQVRNKEIPMSVFKDSQEVRDLVMQRGQLSQEQELIELAGTARIKKITPSKVVNEKELNASRDPNWFYENKLNGTYTFELEATKDMKLCRGIENGVHGTFTPNSFLIPCRSGHYETAHGLHNIAGTPFSTRPQYTSFVAVEIKTRKALKTEATEPSKFLS